MISLQGKTNFFEKRVSDYSKAGVNASAQGNNAGPIAQKSLYVFVSLTQQYTYLHYDYSTVSEDF